MTAYDIVVLAVLSVSCLLGLLRGLLKEVLSLLAFATAVVAAVWWGPTVYDWLTPYIEAPVLRMVAGYVTVFIVTLLLVGLLNMTLAALVRGTGLSTADHGLGGLFGLLRGVVLVLAGTAIAGYTPMPEQAWWKDAMFSDTAERAVAGAVDWLGVHRPSWLPVRPPVSSSGGVLDGVPGAGIMMHDFQGRSVKGGGL